MILLFFPLGWLLRVETDSDWSVALLILNNLTLIHKIGSPKGDKAFGEINKQ